MLSESLALARSFLWVPGSGGGSDPTLLVLGYCSALLSLLFGLRVGCWSLPGVATSTYVSTIFSIGCLGWDDDEGCSKV